MEGMKLNDWFQKECYQIDLFVCLLQIMVFINSEAFLQMSVFFIVTCIGLRSVNHLGIKPKKLHCDRNAMSDLVLASFIHNTSIARLTRSEVVSNFYIKCIVTNKYASRVLEYNNTNSQRIYA